MEYVYLFMALMMACGGAVWLYRMGVRDGQRLASGRPVIADRVDEVDEIPYKVKRMQTVFDNIDAYDGTSKGQVKV